MPHPLTFVRWIIMNQEISHPLPHLSLTTSLSVDTALPIVQMKNLRPREVIFLMSYTSYRYGFSSSHVEV